ncbi:MAG: alpha-2-macroglobulin family protein, partial [Opitutales bacterium]
VAGANLPFQVAGDWSKVSFEVAGLEDFYFGDKDSHESVSISSIDGMTDETGSASVFPPSDRLTPGFWEAAGYVTITSTGGASVSDRFTLRKLSAPRLIGVRIANGGKPFASEAFSVELVAAGPLADEVPVGNVEVVLEKLETDWVMQRVDGHWTWHRREDAFEVASKLVENVAGAGEGFARIEMTCPEPGAWRLVVRDLVGGAVTKVRLDVPRAGQPVAAIGSPHRVGLSLDRASYRPGEVARVAVKAPFAGELLLSVETDHVAWAQTFSLSKTQVTLDVPLPKNMPGGAFVTASIVRSLDFESPEWKPHRAYGMVRLATDFSEQRIEVELDVLDKVTPGTEVTVRAKVKADESAYVHLWAVDEGVLSVTDYKTPDPTDRFFGPWRAKIDSGDLYLELLPDHKRPGSMERFGAGGGASRRSLVKARPPKTVILWNEFVPVGKDGLVESKFAIPTDFTGEVRFMAVAVAGNSYGSAESALTVASPLLVEMSLPRFVAPGDKFLSPVTLFNSTDEDIVGETEFAVSGPVRLLGVLKRTVALSAGGSSTIWFKMEAERGMGLALVSVKASGNGLLAEARGTFPVRPAATLDAAYETFVMNAGESRTIELSKRFLADGVKRTVTLSASPVTDLRPALDDLLGFPYGCVEQTTSKVMPLAYAAQLLGGGKAEFAKEAVLAGIERLSTMQTRSGGLAYWPGGREPNLWGTCYASSFLIEAKIAGHSIEIGRAH